MTSKLPKPPDWLITAMQGLAFWMGHRQALFRFYPLTEGALVAEACNLIQANLPSDMILLPECMYKNIVSPGANLIGVTGQSRVDLVVCGAAAKPIGRDGNVASELRCILEVKRGSATESEINNDLKRLHCFLAATNANVQAFLLVICEGRAPSRFVQNGVSVRGLKQIPNTNGHYRVRRTVKAASSFSGKSSAQYVCLIEALKG